MKRLSVLGSTGSIGRSTLEVVAAFPERFAVTALAAGRSLELLERQILRFDPACVVTSDEETAGALRRRIGSRL